MWVCVCVRLYIWQQWHRGWSWTWHCASGTKVKSQSEGHNVKISMGLHLGWGHFFVVAFTTCTLMQRTDWCTTHHTAVACDGVSQLPWWCCCIKTAACIITHSPSLTEPSVYRYAFDSGSCSCTMPTLSDCRGSLELLPCLKLILLPIYLSNANQ